MLDKARLTRLVSILSSGSTIGASTFEVTFASGRKLNLTSVDEVVDLDNALSDPITELEITRGGADSASVNFDSDDMMNINFRIRADNQFANQLYGELADQMDRIRVRSIMAVMASPLGRLVISVCLAVALIIGLVSLFAPTSSPVGEHAAVQNLLRRAHAAQSDHDKLQIVFEKSLRELEAAAALPDNKAGARRVDLRMLFVILPLLIVSCSFIYLLWRAYPWAVFRWGDGEHRYNATLDRRRFVWSVIVIALILGIVSNLFVVSLPSFA